MKRKLYFAAPLFCESELKYNLYLRDKFLKFFDVFLPQEDNGLVFDALEAGENLNSAFESTFNGDIAAIDGCDVLFILLDGRSVDEGACFELGYAFANNKICIGLQTDSRQLMKHGNNPMLVQALTHLFKSEKELIAWMSENTPL